MGAGEEAGVEFWTGDGLALITTVHQLSSGVSWPSIAGSRCATMRAIGRTHVINFRPGHPQHAAVLSRGRFDTVKKNLDELVEVRSQVRTIVNIGDMYSKKCFQRRIGNGRARA